MAIIVYKTWTTMNDMTEIFCNEEGVNITIDKNDDSYFFCYEYGDVDLLIEFLQKNRLDKK
jgi:hypothetical protein